MRLPDFIIIGAMKCATSTVHEQLASQQGVVMSRPKEPNFFSDDDAYARGIEWYASLFAAAGEGDLCGESSTHYTKLPTHPYAVDRMASHLVDRVRLIYIMRHPIDRLVSQYIHEWSQRSVHGTIDQAVERYPFLVDYSRYAMQVRPYIERFGSDRVLPVFFERIEHDPQPELDRIARFIGYQGTMTWRHDVGAQNVSRERLRKNTLRDVIVNQPVLKSLRRRFVPQAWRDRVKRLWTLEERPILSSETARRLRDIFDEDLASLKPWCGVQLTCDSFPQRVLSHQPSTPAIAAEHAA